jgi:hypothetical protein
MATDAHHLQHLPKSGMFTWYILPAQTALISELSVRVETLIREERSVILPASPYSYL